MNATSKEELRARIADWLIEMEPMFDSRCKLTFVMRAPHLPDGDLIVTADDVNAVITALQRLRGYEEVRSPLADIAEGLRQKAELEKASRPSPEAAKET